MDDGISKMSRIKRALKFLFFLEEQPKHKVVKSAYPLIVFAMFQLPLAFILGFLMLVWYMAFGLVGFGLGYLALILLVIEVPHVLLDR